MKTTNYLFILIICFISIHTDAQFSLGLRGAYVKSWMEYGDAAVPEGAIIHVKRFQVSALVDYRLSQHLSIGIEPGFTQRGAACFPGWIDFLGDTKLLLNYFELPVVAKVSVPILNNKFEVYGKGGIGISKVITAYRHINKPSSGGPPENRRLDMKSPALRKWDEGVYGGFGIARKFNNHQLFLDVNYYHGFKDIDPVNTSKNRSLQYGLGYIMNL